MMLDARPSSHPLLKPAAWFATRRRAAHRRVLARSGNHRGASYLQAMKMEISQLLEASPIFWSRLWPAGLALGRYLLSEPALIAGKTVLELGCGLGPGAVCAAIAGAKDVIATDIERKALDFVAQSGRDNGVRVRTAVWDWNEQPPPALKMPVDVVLAGDVIYSEAHAPRLGQLITTLVRSGGGVRRRPCVCSPSLPHATHTSHALSALP